VSGADDGGNVPPSPFSSSTSSVGSYSAPTSSNSRVASPPVSLLPPVNLHSTNSDASSFSLNLVPFYHSSSHSLWKYSFTEEQIAVTQGGLQDATQGAKGGGGSGSASSSSNALSPSYFSRRAEHRLVQFALSNDEEVFAYIFLVTLLVFFLCGMCIYFSDCLECCCLHWKDAPL
jgi:hypothetical protein